MSNVKLISIFSILFFSALGLSGCGSENLYGSETVSNYVAQTEFKQKKSKPIANRPEDTADHDPFAPPEIPPEENTSPSFDYASIKPNEIGQIMILMYHSIVDQEPRNQLERSAEYFYNDLIRLYHDGYRIANMSDLVNNEITVAAGFSPVVLTFDDGWSSAFSFASDEITGQLIPKQGTAVDIMNHFNEEYPDFGKGAVFYVNGYMEPFQGEGTLTQRLHYLVENGYEIGNHTFSHRRLSRLSELEVQEEMMWLHGYIKEVLPDYNMLTMAYPYGERPIPELRHYALKGEVSGYQYSYEWALREGPSGAVAAPNHIDFDPINVPRVRASNNETMDLWWYLDYYLENPEFRYISDGDPDVITVPEEFKENINMDSVGHKTLFLYDRPVS